MLCRGWIVFSDFANFEPFVILIFKCDWPRILQHECQFVTKCGVILCFWWFWSWKVSFRWGGCQDGFSELGREAVSFKRLEDILLWNLSSVWISVCSNSVYCVTWFIFGHLWKKIQMHILQRTQSYSKREGYSANKDLEGPWTITLYFNKATGVELTPWCYWAVQASKVFCHWKMHTENYSMVAWLIIF